MNELLKIKIQSNTLDKLVISNKTQRKIYDDNITYVIGNDEDVLELSKLLINNTSIKTINFSAIDK